MSYQKKFRYNFHDSQLIDIIIGPRREITLEIFLCAIWHKEMPPVVNMRFGDIKNFDEVKTFFNKIKKDDKWDFICEIIQIVWKTKDTVIVDLDIYGSIEINSRKVTES